MNIGTYGIDVGGGGVGCDQGVRIGGEDGGEGFQDEASVVGGDLESIGEGGGGDTAETITTGEGLGEGDEGLGGIGEDELLDGEEAVLEGLPPWTKDEEILLRGSLRWRRRRRRNGALAGIRHVSNRARRGAGAAEE